VRWYGDGPSALAEERTAILLPTALPAAEELRRPLTLAASPSQPARRITLATTTDPEHVVASLSFEK
jgi:hypothetical protein